MKGLTDRQREILDWIVAFIGENGMPPTVREIAREFGIDPAVAFRHLRALERKGYVRRGKLGARSLEVACMRGEESTDSVRLPLAGRVEAGTPVLAVENIEGSVTVDRSMVGRDAAQYFALRVKGDSMIEAGIYDGDVAVVRKQETAEDGQIVVALTGDDEGTLKRFYLDRKKRRVRLQPANSGMKPVYAKDVTIQGVVKGVIRKLN